MQQNCQEGCKQEEPGQLKWATVQPRDSPGMTQSGGSCCVSGPWVCVLLTPEQILNCLYLPPPLRQTSTGPAQDHMLILASAQQEQEGGLSRLQTQRRGFQVPVQPKPRQTSGSEARTQVGQVVVVVVTAD